MRERGHQNPRNTEAVHKGRVLPLIVMSQKSSKKVIIPTVQCQVITIAY